VAAFVDARRPQGRELLKRRFRQRAVGREHGAQLIAGSADLSTAAADDMGAEHGRKGAPQRARPDLLREGGDPPATRSTALSVPEDRTRIALAALPIDRHQPSPPMSSIVRSCQARAAGARPAPPERSRRRCRAAGLARPTVGATLRSWFQCGTEAGCCSQLYNNTRLLIVSGGWGVRIRLTRAVPHRSGKSR
jgi:hypothetical protein